MGLTMMPCLVQTPGQDGIPEQLAMQDGGSRLEPLPAASQQQTGAWPLSGVPQGRPEALDTSQQELKNAMPPPAGRAGSGIAQAWLLWSL